MPSSEKTALEVGKVTVPPKDSQLVSSRLWEDTRTLGAWFQRPCFVL